MCSWLKKTLNGMPSTITSSKMRSKKITTMDTKNDNTKPIKMRFGVNLSVENTLSKYIKTIAFDKYKVIP